MRTKIYCILVFIQSYSFSYQTDVHQEITSEAFYLLQHFFPGIEFTELGIQFGSIGNFGERQWQTGEVLAGVYREDLEDVVWGYGPESSLPIGWLFNSTPTATTTHFWVADNGDDYQTSGVGWPWGGDFPNAYQKALKFINGGWKIQFLEQGSNYIKEYTYNNLIELAKTGIVKQTGYYTVFPVDYTALNPPQIITLSNSLRKRFVYEILGRVLHLLQDMSVPAHAHGDSHPDMSNSLFFPCFGVDWCEQADEYENIMTKSFVHNRWDWIDALNAGGLLINNEFITGPIKYLFYTTNQVADFFPSSCDPQPFICYPGNSNTPMGSNSVINNIYSNFNYQCPSSIDAYQFGNVNYVLSIRATASLLYWYAYEMDYIKTITITSSKIDDFVQVRNPARSIPPYTSQYYWQPTPYTLKFENSITVDLLADAYSGTHCFLDWVKRDKNNLTVGFNSQLEWLDANATATSTFIANYSPWVTVSFAPIQIESATANAHYENISTGETGSSFTFPQGYPINIKAVVPDGYIFLKWSDDYIGNPRSFNPNSNISGIYASFKKVGASDNINSYKNCGQRKFVKNYSGVLFSVYPSMEKVWIEYSTNNGQTWQLGNKEKPLFGGLQAKNPSIEFWNKGIDETQLLIAAQVNVNGEPDIQVSRLKWESYMSSWPELFTEKSHIPIEPSVFWYGAYTTTNLYPVLGMIEIGGFLIAIPLPEANLIWIEGERILNDYSFTEFDWEMIQSENELLNASLHSSKLELDCAQTDEYQCWLAYEEKIGSNSSKIVVTKLYFDPWSWNNIIYTPPFTVSENDGFSNNYSPSITAWRESEASATTTAAAVVWIGYREAYADNPIYSTGETKVILRRFSNGVWSPSFQTYGSSINSVNINKNTDKSYAFAWSQGNNNINYYVKSSYLNRLNSANTNGKYLQVGNFTNLNNMRLNAFRTSTSPYSFQLSNVFGYTQEEEVRTDRASIIVKDTTSFYFAIGDIAVNDEMVGFVEIPDSIIIDSKENLNTYLLSEPFNLTDNTNFIYGIKFGVSDSISAVTSLNDNKSVHFKVQLIDDQTGEVIGTLDNIVFDSENIIPYENIAYQVNTMGIGDRICRLKLIADDNLDFNYSLVNSYNDETTLSKKGFIEKIFNGNEVVKSYALAQNYPNPFNPNTTIRYQIPKNVLVTLKIYDILGAEVATLVNEEKITGKYEVNFNASSLSSGVYIYRIQAGDFVNSKKMLLLK